MSYYIDLALDWIVWTGVMAVFMYVLYYFVGPLWGAVDEYFKRQDKKRNL